MPISGRLRTTSSRLPTHIDTMMPQNRAGSSVATLARGDPRMIIALIIRAMTGFAGMPKVSMGMKEVCAAALLADSGPATPSIAPLPKRSGVFDLLFHGVRERGQDVAAARQDAEQGAEDGAAHHRRRDAAQVLAARHQAADLPHRHVAVVLVLEIAQDLGDAEHADRERDEIEPVGERAGRA